MQDSTRKAIFCLEDDPNWLMDYYAELSKEHDLTIGADWRGIKQARVRPFDLLLLDLMIHRVSEDENGNEIENVFFEGVHWRRTGLAFLEKLRDGEYEEFGFPRDMLVLAVSAVADTTARERAQKDLGAVGWIAKPPRMQQLETAVREALTKGTEKEVTSL